MPNRGEILFVLSDNRSGSTLLSQLLGAHPEIVAPGEVHWLDAYVTEDRRLYNPKQLLVCACDETVSNCGFWQEVAAVIDRPLDALILRMRFFSWPIRYAKFNPIRWFLAAPRVLLRWFPGLYSSASVRRFFGSKTLTQDLLSLADAMFEVSGSRFMVDASKNSFRFRSVFDQQPDRARAVILVRDYRAVTWSKMKRGIPLGYGANTWRRKILEIESMTGDLPADRCYAVKYESLCNEPEKQLRMLCDFLGVDFNPAMLTRPGSGTHFLGGSPSKFDPERREVRLDTDFEGQFTEGQLDRMKRIVGRAAERWGY